MVVVSSRRPHNIVGSLFIPSGSKSSSTAAGPLVSSDTREGSRWCARRYPPNSTGVRLSSSTAVAASGTMVDGRAKDTNREVMAVAVECKGVLEGLLRPRERERKEQWRL